MSFPPGTEMFQFPGFASLSYVFRQRYRRNGGLPHSEIHGSKLVRSSPWLIAAYHVLHRLLPPRHPPNALKSLDALIINAHRSARGARSAEPRLTARRPPYIRSMPARQDRPGHRRNRPDFYSSRLTRRRVLRRRRCACGLRRCGASGQSPLHDVKQCFRPGAKARGETVFSQGKNRPDQAPAKAGLVEPDGIEPTTSCLQSRRSSN
jgi:hypothetical protein